MRKRLLLHLGLHKTGTTFLQKSVWPRWGAVSYAGRPTPKGHVSSEQAVFSMDGSVILVSNESSGGSLKRSYLKGVSWDSLREGKLIEMKRLYSGKYDLGVIIGLRKPEPWVLSVYKHYLKYGGVETLEGFLGLEADCPPTLSPSDLLNMPKIRQIGKVLGVSPFCFFLEEMRSHPAELSAAIATYARVSEGPDFGGDAGMNEGVDEAEARCCLLINRLIVNPGCRGKGHIRRNKTLGFDLARWIRSTKAKPSPALLASSPTSASIRTITEEDLAETIRLIAEVRGGQQDWATTLRHLLCSKTDLT